MKIEILLKIANSYDLSLEFVEQFPDFIRQIFSKTIEDFADPVKKQSQVVFLGPLPQVDYNENESSVSDINNPISDEEIGENIDTEPEATALFRFPRHYQEKQAYLIDYPFMILLSKPK